MSLSGDYLDFKLMRLKKNEAANIFDLLYKSDGGGIVVSAARADRSPRPHDHE
jgi:hypothetical protein